MHSSRLVGNRAGLEIQPYYIFDRILCIWHNPKAGYPMAGYQAKLISFLSIVLSKMVKYRNTCPDIYLTVVDLYWLLRTF